MTRAVPGATRQLGGPADLRSLEARIQGCNTGEVADGAYSSTAFMNYVKPVLGSKKFSAASLAGSSPPVG